MEYRSRGWRYSSLIPGALWWVWEEDRTGWGHVVDIRMNRETMASFRRHWEIVPIIKSHGGSWADIRMHRYL